MSAPIGLGVVRAILMLHPECVEVTEWEGVFTWTLYREGSPLAAKGGFGSLWEALVDAPMHRDEVT